MCEWRAVVGFEGFYEVSSDGRIRHARFNRELKQVAARGYKHAHLSRTHPRLTKTARVHHLVAAAFLGPRAAGIEVNHKNCDKADNRVENLEYVTSQENTAHAVQMGRQPRGERHGRAKLTESQVKEIAASREPLKVVAARYGIERSTVWYIRKRKLWKHLASQP